MKLPGFISQYGGLRREIYVLFFGRIVTNLGSMIWPMLTLILSQKMGMNASSIAVLSAVTTFIMIPANLLGGRLADRRNKKLVIVYCDAVSVLAYIACGVLPLGYATIALMLIGSIAQSMEYPSYNALFADLTTTRDRERAFSLEYLGANLGLVLSPSIAGILFKNYLWLSFIISGAAIGLSTVLIFFLVRDVTPEPDDSDEAVYQKSRGRESLLRIFRDNKPILVYVAVMSFYYSAYGQYNYLMPLDMGRVHGEDGAVLFGTVSSLNCIVVVLFTPLITRIFRNMTDLRKILTGQTLVVVGYFVFIALLGRIPAYYVAMLLFTWGEIFDATSEGPYLSNRIPASHRGRINGFSAVVNDLVNSACNLSVGALYDARGSSAAWCVVFGILAAAVALTAGLIFADRKKYPKLYSGAPAPAAPDVDQ